ncbi:fumarylacetoacetate hydrolase family protein [Pelagibius sp. Alg239-R121]|uniref:fumarylacetoacetate hydrolase family protein n=1 Tax=Pelagibius sp. Alg239-R121 TaxID=2993448 RepID=UPI0024A6EBC5|nr:fumarylacetoacetate hydrolase family protein [Pelagibius sp. Alg239-R121]
MRFVTYRSGNEPRPALEVDGGTLLDLATAFSRAKASGSVKDTLEVPKDITGIIAGGPALADACRTILREAQAGVLSEAQMPIGSVSLMAPIPRPAKNVFCVGSNYRAHVTESSRAQKKEDKVPKRPVFFTKPPTAVVGPGDAIRLDPAVSDKMDYEVELGVVIGKPGRNIKAADVLDHIFGFTIINDVTARDLQRAHGGQFLKGKGLDTCCPMGPQIVTLDELPNFENLRISIKVNGELRQDGSTGDLIFPIAHLLEQLSEGLTLESGDLLATGTPSGVGYAMDPPQFLKNGDILTCEIEGIGQLTNSVRDVSKEGLAA